MTTLVVCVDRTDDIGRKTGVTTPVSGWEAVQSLVTDVGLADPEDSAVNALLESLRIARELRDVDEEAVVAVVSGASGSAVSADRAIASQLDQLVERYEPDSAIVVIDSAEDERVVPIVESRTRVDSVDRVVVRQARDIESTYYLLKQFLADEELRRTTLVPLGVVLLVFPLLAVPFGPAVATAAITAVIGVFLLYLGLSVDDYVSVAVREGQEALYSGQVSVVTYVVAAGLTLIGVFAGALGASDVAGSEAVVIPTMAFVHDAVPWVAGSALTASAGRLLDEALQNDRVRTSYLNLPFAAVAVGLVVRGFSGYFLEQWELLGSMVVPTVSLGATSVGPFTLDPGQRLAVFVIAGLVVSLIGMRIATRVQGTDLEPEPDSPGDRADPDQ